MSAFIQRTETGMDARRRLKTMMHISFSRKAQVYITRNIVCVIYVLLALASFLSLSGEQEQNRKEKYPSGSEETSCDQCTWPCIFFNFSCEYKNRGNRNCKIFKEYEAGSERGYSFQSTPGRTDTAGYCRAISGDISGIYQYEYGDKASGRT